MYYHFCLIALFRPYVDVVPYASDIQPREICAEAAQSILALAQSYDRLFTLRRFPGFVPYFIVTSGVLSLAMEDKGMPLEAAHVRIGDAVAPMTIADPGQADFVINQYGGPATAPYIKLSAVKHARSLISKLNPGHPAVSNARSRLEEGSNPGGNM